MVPFPVQFSSSRPPLSLMSNLYNSTSSLVLYVTLYRLSVHRYKLLSGPEFLLLVSTLLINSGIAYFPMSHSFPTLRLVNVPFLFVFWGFVVNLSPCFPSRELSTISFWSRDITSFFRVSVPPKTLSDLYSKTGQSLRPCPLATPLSVKHPF